jgi:hypothetical protein
MNGDEIPPIGDLNLQDPLPPINLDAIGGGGEAVVGVVVQDDIVIDFIDVSVEVWEALQRQALERHKNKKGKKQKLCLKCRLWFEAKIGLITHQRSCSLPEPRCEGRSPNIPSSPVSSVSSNSDSTLDTSDVFEETSSNLEGGGM